jgi:hypothetical protein
LDLCGLVGRVEVQVDSVLAALLVVRADEQEGGCGVVGGFYCDLVR